MKSFRDLFYLTKKHSKKWENYFEVYDKHLSPYRYLQPKILEIGIAHGGSTEMFQNYFDLCTIHAVDYDPNFEHVVDDLNVKVTIGDQASPEFWDNYLKDKPDFDIIIDDGGHTMEQQIVTLIKTFPKLKVGGIYLVEDTHTSYWKDWGGGLKNPDSFIEMTKGFIDVLHHPFIVGQQPHKDLLEILENLWSITYYNSIVIFEKRKSLPNVEANNRQ